MPSLTGVPKGRGQSGSELLVFACLVAGLQSWIPLLELLSERAVEGARPGLQHEMRTGLRPPHLLTFAKTLAHNRVDGTFHEPGGDTLAIAPPLGIVGNHPGVYMDASPEARSELGVMCRQIAALYSAFGAAHSARQP